ncbi:MAG: TylF/MycF family methyltransferase [Candidatus Pristimantibacillus lignocellulolyticus]|uniref:TylF/MycF family methyltransferase n=1 Tax=Candidatus Pristimantibacillus lignocellulolyticus TaxID=2994561 RepID=A0A9J6ZJW4_9BACL|nr:MAG: TylF/MycF family methyltransferase [Candidatus Pristimantibacillus lignocellulolyticus]
MEKYDDFEKYARRQAISRFLARYELFKLQMNIKGSIVECGVHKGAGIMGWAKLSAALEPYSLDRRIIGFDTFEGFPNIHDADLMTEESKNNDKNVIGGFYEQNVYDELLELVQQYDENRYLNQFQKVHLVKGDAVETIPQYVKDNSHLLISLLFMDFDLYEPTKVALQNFLPRMSKGSVLAFDEINNPWWPGETIAMLEELSIKDYTINRFSFDPNISYIVL